MNNINIYKKRLMLDSNQTMVSLQHFIPDILLDLRYSTTNNFTHTRMYPASVNYSFLRMPAAKALKKVQAELNEKGFGLKIFDAYRPYSVTKKFWVLIHDERYVANPAKGSGHNRGIAVDLTIVDLKTGRELDMGTGFDNFTDSAHQTFTTLPENILANRKLLQETMEKYGFELFKTEWWHYSLPDPEKYAVLDLTFEKLKKVTK